MSDYDSIPIEFLCPITLDIMKEPMVMPDGQTYEKEAIRKALEVTHVSPMTKMPMDFSDGVINYALKSLIENYIKEHNLDVDNVNKDNIESKMKNLNITKKKPVEFEEIFARYISEDKSAGLCKDSLHVCMKPKKVDTTPPVCLICVVDVSGSMRVNSCNNIDSMESMNLSRLGLIKHSLNTIVSTLRKDDMICVIEFSDSAHVAVRPIVLANKDIKNNVMNNINNMSASGATNMWSGIKLALDTSATIPSEMYNKFIMVFTDGDSNCNPPQGVYQTLKETLKYSEDKITISTFSYGNEVGPELLIDIANLGDGSFGYCPDGTMVGTIFINYMANILSTITPVAKVIVTQGDDIKKTMTVGPLYRGDHRNAIFKVDSTLFDKTKVTVELPFINQTFDVPITTESPDLQNYMDEMAKSEENQKDKQETMNDDDDDDDDDDELLDSDSDEEEDENFKIEDVDTNQLIVESDTIPQKYEEILLNQILRNKFIIILNKIINIKDLGTDSNSNAKGKRMLNKYFELLNNLKYKNKYIKGLIIDIDNPDPNHGQVEKAIDLKYYKKWGKSYLSSFLRFHQYEQCGNFKDQSLQYYSYEVFSIYRKMANRIFINLPPPKQDEAASPPPYRLMNTPLFSFSSPQSASGPRSSPLSFSSPLSASGTRGSIFSSLFNTRSRNRDSCCRDNDCSGSTNVPLSMTSNASINVASRNMGQPIKMKRFLDRHGGCFDGDSMVLLANNETKRVRDLKKGDRLRNNSVVRCLIEQKQITTSNPYMCNINGVLFTPYHPVAIRDTWYFPVDLVKPQPIAIGSWFNLVLEDELHKKYEVEFQCGVKAITLGHYRTENKILEHPYFGTDRVLKDLQERDPQGYAEGYILIKEYNPRALQFDKNGCCINYYQSKSIETPEIQKEDDENLQKISVLN